MTFHVVKNLFYILICIASVGSNSLLITILLKCEHLRTTSNLFVLNLAFCDMTTVILGIPFAVAIEETSSYPFGEVGCKILMPGATAAFNSAAFTLLSIAIDRFYAIMFPMRARLQSCKTKCFVLCVLHGISILSVAPFGYHMSYTTNKGKSECSEDWPEGGGRIYTLCLFIIQYCVPLTLIAILYSISWNQIRKQNKVIIKMQQQQQRGECHYNRSASWDVAMKKSDSTFSALDSAGRREETRMVKSSSSAYSFKSNHLEAVEEAVISEALMTSDTVTSNDCSDDVIHDGITTTATIIATSKSSSNAKGSSKAETESAILRDESTPVLPKVESNTHGDKNKYAGGSSEKEELLRTNKTERRKVAKRPAGKLSLPIVLQEQEEFLEEELGEPQAKCSIFDVLSCQPSLRFPFVNKAFLKRGNNNGSKELHEVSGQDYSHISQESGPSSVIQSPTSERTHISTHSCDAAKQPIKQIAAAHSSSSFTLPCVSGKSTRKMSHSASSPAFSSSYNADARRKDPMAVAGKKFSYDPEARLSRLGQLAAHARRRISAALTSSSSDNMCMASMKRMRQTRRTLRMFTCVVVVFAICMLPNQITWIWMSYNDGVHIDHVIYTVFYFLTYTNSVINPWIYGAVNPSFRKAYRKVFTCKKSQVISRNDKARNSSKLSSLWLSLRGSDPHSIDKGPRSDVYGLSRNGIAKRTTVTDITP